MFSNQETTEYQYVVVGGGAAGFFSAIEAAEHLPSGSIAILERTSHPLSKVLISGGGRCNVTHACFDPAKLVQFYPRGHKELRGPFSRFQPRDTMEWFQSHGVALKIEKDGRVFPVSDSSKTIYDCLTKVAESKGVIYCQNQAVERIEKTDRGFIISIEAGRQIKAEKVLLATGSHPRGFAFAKSLGHNIVPPVPSLFTFRIDPFVLKELAGISIPHVRLRIDQSRFTQEGPLLITHWGFSGPAVLKLSAFAAHQLHERGYQTTLIIDWLPEHTDIDENLTYLPKHLWKTLLDIAGIPTHKTWSKKEKTHLVNALKNDKYLISGKIPHKEEFVTCGGVDLKEVNFKTMESRICPGLYFAGEVLDIDGVTGGFNFQNAWTTGWIAGNSVASLQK